VAQARDDADRLPGIDLVRVLGVVAIIAGHVWYTPDTAHLLTYSWHVPVFFILAGYLWHDDRSTSAELATRWRSIVVPYVLWWFIVAAVYLIWVGVEGHSFSSAAYYLVLAVWGGALAFRPFTAFWFFSAFVIAVLVLRVLQGRPAWWAWVLAVAAIVFCHLATPVAVHSPLAAAQAVGCVLFILVGQVLRRVRSRVGRPGPVGLGLVAAGAALTALPGYRTLEIKSADFGTPVLSELVACLLGIGLILLAERVTEGVRTRTGTVITTLAACSTVMILVHGVPMLLLGTPRSGGWVDFVLVLTASTGPALVVLATRWAPWLSGRPMLHRIGRPGP
jgi:acyltransferase